MHPELPLAGAAGPRPYLLTLGDLLLDVLVDGDLRRESDTTGAVQLYPGGSAANFAAGAAQQGARVRFVGRVGADAAGKLLVQDLQDRGILTEVRVVPGSTTGTVLVIRNGDGPGSSRMWSNPGASATLDPADLDPQWFAGLDAFHLTGYSLLRPGPRPAALHALALARSGAPGVLCSLDPNPGHLLADAGPAWFRNLVAELHVDLLFPNLEEGRLLAGADDPPAIVDRLLSLAPLVVLTLGARGCLLGWGGERRHLAAARAHAVDTTGAGDAFAAGFVTAYLANRDPIRAAAAATAAAAAVVKRPGGR
ncbi:MAG TPA: PfkB family carbohydrate kinase [Chloroflexia bacterium]|nr:PfkB family carbohydrate kinase [Chloroflexia bacterium]